MRGQASTEYIVILAVVLVVALVVIGLLGQFTGFSTAGLEQQSTAYWQATSPFSIQNAKVSGNTVQLDIKNQLTQRLNLTNISFDGVDVGTGARTFAPGQTVTLGGTITGFNCTSAQPYEFTKVIIRYDQGSISGLTQVGDKSLAGKCS
ncbi:Uncharacterised protein [uncultured archaeon]|nr:Uncharacterised protein [uncultured archaeon]